MSAERQDRTGCTDGVPGRKDTWAGLQKGFLPGAAEWQRKGGVEKEGACVKGQNCEGPASMEGRRQGRLAGGGARPGLTLKALGVWHFSTFTCMYIQRWGFRLMNTN